MNQDPSTPYHWLPILSLQPGMVTARPVVGFSGNLETMFVAVGATITAGVLEQMITKGVECVAVVEKEIDSAAPPDAKVTDYQSRLSEIFGPTPNAACQPMLDALLAATEVLC